MAPLMLDTLEIHNFRLFQHLRIPRLSRVNLIVGTNNIGKTSLLEALWLYARRGVPAVLWEQLAVREESNRPSAFSDTGYTIQAINNIFSGRGDAQESNRTVTVGPAGRRQGTLRQAHRSAGTHRYQEWGCTAARIADTQYHNSHTDRKEPPCRSKQSCAS